MSNAWPCWLRFMRGTQPRTPVPPRYLSKSLADLSPALLHSLPRLTVFSLFYVVVGSFLYSWSRCLVVCFICCFDNIYYTTLFVFSFCNIIYLTKILFKVYIGLLLQWKWPLWLQLDIVQSMVWSLGYGLSSETNRLWIYLGEK